MPEKIKILNKGYRFKRIKTKRLVLVKPSLKYVNDYYNILLNKNLWKLNGGGNDIYTKLKIRKNILNKIKLWKKQKKFSFFIIYNNELIGAIGSFNEILDHNSLELGYLIKSEFWNKGLGTEALNAYLNWIFTNTSINRVSACVATPHIASIKVIEKNGFIREGIMREAALYHNKRYDDYLYAILKKDWVKKRLIKKEGI